MTTPISVTDTGTGADAVLMRSRQSGWRDKVVTDGASRVYVFADYGSTFADYLAALPGTYAGTPTLQQPSTALGLQSATRFTGTSGQYATITTFSFATAFTIEIVFRANTLRSNAANGLIQIGTEPNFLLRIGDVGLRTGQLNGDVGNVGFPATTSNFDIATATNYHAAITSDGITAKLYLNGVLASTATSPGAPASGALKVPWDNSDGREMDGWVFGLAYTPSALNAVTISEHSAAALAANYPFTEYGTGTDAVLASQVKAIADTAAGTDTIHAWTPSTALNNAIQADTPYAYWWLSETSGTTATDQSGNAHNGAYSGGYALAAGLTPAGAGAAFDGGSGSMQVASNGVERWSFTNFTMSCAIWLPSLITDRQVLMTPNYPGSGSINMSLGFNLDGANPQLLQGGWFDGSNWRVVTYATPLSLSTWYHLAISWDGTTLRLYVNGTQVATATPGGATSTPSSFPLFYIAQRWDNGGSPFTAVTMQHAAVFNKTLAAARIAAQATALFAAMLAETAVADDQVQGPLGERATATDALSASLLLADTATATDAFVRHIAGAPHAYATLDDVEGLADVEVSYLLNGHPYVTLDPITGRTDIELTVRGPAYASLDPIDGVSEVRFSYLLPGLLYAELDPIDGASRVLLTAPVTTTAIPEIAGDLRLNTPIEMAMMLTGRIAVTEAVDVA